MSEAPKRQSIAIPGYAECLRQTQLVRDMAFLETPDGRPVCESIAGYDVIQLTPMRYNMLRLAGCPLLLKRDASPVAVFQFLWVLSPDYTQDVSSRARKNLETRCHDEFFPVTPDKSKKRSAGYWKVQNITRIKRGLKIIDAAHAYIAEAFMDRPPQASGRLKQSYYSDNCWLCATMGREFGWLESATLNMPFKRLFQYINEILQHHDPKAIMANPSDALNAKFLDEINKSRPKEPPKE